MVFIFPLAIWLGIAAIISLFTTLSLGVAYYHFKKNVFKYHRFFAFLTGAIAVIHAVFAMMLFSGVAL
jgi:hypothetical protein